jgi:hypothetical protein
MDFVIDRSKWRAGGFEGDRYNSRSASAIGEGPAQLLNEDRFMCCLGQISEQLGVSRSVMLGISVPSDMEGCPLILNDSFNESSLAYKAMRINDDFEIDQPRRERKLKALFAEHGHSIKFTGKAARK